jgi:hypothetical protein
VASGNAGTINKNYLGAIDVENSSIVRVKGWHLSANGQDGSPDWVSFDHGTEHWSKHRIPIIIAAQGPKALEVAGEIGDGWMAPASDVQAFRQNLEAVKSAAKRAGRNTQNFSATMFAAARVLKPGESLTSTRLLSQMGPMAAVALHALWEASPVAAQLPPSLRSIMKSTETSMSANSTFLPTAGYLKVHEGHTIYVKPGEERFLTPEVIAAFSLTAP